MNSKFLASIIFYFFIVTNHIFAQENPIQPQVFSGFWDKYYVGGTAGLELGSQGTYIELSPNIGYKLNKKLSVGIGAKYIFEYYSNPAYNISSVTHTYGASVFSRLKFSEHFFGHAEAEFISFEKAETDSYNQLVKIRYDLNYFFLGLGYMQNLGINSVYYILILYDLNQNSIVLSPYGMNPVFRVGFSSRF